MKVILYPERKEWDSLCRRPTVDRSGLDDVVRDILVRVKSTGDRAIYQLSEKFDGVKMNDLKVPVSEIMESVRKVPGELTEAINVAKANIEKFHRSQLINEQVVETTKGVKCWRRNVPIERADYISPEALLHCFQPSLCFLSLQKLQDAGK